LVVHRLSARICSIICLQVIGSLASQGVRSLTSTQPTAASRFVSAELYLLLVRMDLLLT
jgi:hypothetical protein